MPYRNPERKRQWEQQYREQRNARRSMQRLGTRSGHLITPKPEPDRISEQESQDTWKTILGWAMGIGVVLLAVIGGANPHMSSPRPS